MKCILAIGLTLLSGVGLGFLFVSRPELEWGLRISFHIYSYAICFGPDQLIRFLMKKPIQQVTGFMLTQLIRLLGMLFLYILLIIIHKEYAMLALWIFLSSVAAFLCFQVVRATYPHFCGGEPRPPRFKT